MLIEKVNLNEIIDLDKSTEVTPIVEDFFYYFSKFNLERVLVITDEEVNTDIRVLNQLRALQKLTKDITVFRVKPNNNYTDDQKKTVLRKLLFKSLKNILYFPWFFFLVITHHLCLSIRTKAKQGIYNDHSYLLSEKIDTSDYTCVICNNLISASSVDSRSEVDYIYDIHELEVFRNRNKASVQRSFYIYLKEMEELKNKKNVITISTYIANTLSSMYHYGPDYITCIYNQNFSKIDVSSTIESNIKKYLLIYVGSVSIDRGIEDIVRLSFEYDILIIACNYKKDAIDYLEKNSNLNRLKIFKGMNYQSTLLKSIKEYQYPFFLILINPIHPSYRYALPNKFFQAQAVRCPIIVYDKTYLADIVKKYRCGMIYPNSRNTHFTIEIDANEYVSMKESMGIKIAKAIEAKKL